jgi:hypothetical protein
MPGRFLSILRANLEPWALTNRPLIGWYGQPDKPRVVRALYELPFQPNLRNASTVNEISGERSWR